MRRAPVESMTSIRNLSLLFLLVTIAEACLSSGGSSCCCGGCRARARARGASIKSISPDSSEISESIPVEGLSAWTEDLDGKNNETLVDMSNPNYLFRRCCEERQLPPGCINKCNFNTFNRNALQSMYMKMDKCPLEYASELQFCAAQGRDHTQCCSRNGVATTLAGQKCLTFCDQTPDRITRLDFSYIPCYERFENMKQCFFSQIKSSAERRFLGKESFQGNYRRH